MCEHNFPLHHSFNVRSDIFVSVAEIDSHTLCAVLRKDIVPIKILPLSAMIKKTCVSLKWWEDFGTTENLSVYRAINSNREILDNFYKESGGNFVGCEEEIKTEQDMGLCYVVKSGRVVTKARKM